MLSNRVGIEGNLKGGERKRRIFHSKELRSAMEKKANQVVDSGIKVIQNYIKVSKEEERVSIMKPQTNEGIL